MKNEINVGYYRVSVDTTGNEDSVKICSIT